MKHIAKIILTVLLLPGLSGCEQPSTSDPKEGNEVSVMLEVLSEQLHTTRAIAESDIDDVNIFIYSATGGLKQHIYASGASHKIRHRTGAIQHIRSSEHTSGYGGFIPHEAPVISP